MTMRDTSQDTHTLHCTVVVTTWKRPPLLRDTLDSLMTQTYRSMDVMVVCDGEDPDVRKVAEDFHGPYLVHWIFHQLNRGLPAARNTGAREAGGEIVLFLDDDVVACSELVEAHMHHHLSVGEGRRLAVCSLTNEERHTCLSSYLDQCLHDSWKRAQMAFAGALGAVGADSVGDDFERVVWFGLNSSIRRSVFLEQDGFNEHFRASDEEVELGLRLYLAGVEFLFEPRRLLTHMNTKRPSAYFRSVWSASGHLDPYRVFDLKQKNSQTQKLVSMFRGSLSDQVTARCAWHLFGALRIATNWLETATERTRRRFLSAAWVRTCQAAEYWSSVKAAGCTSAQLKSVVGSSKCALMLHSISEPLTQEEATYYIAPRRFRRLMRWFCATGYKTLTLAEWLGDAIPPKGILLTFDDAYDDLYEHLLPWVIKYRYTPLIFLVAGRIGESNVWDQKSGLRARNLLTLEQVREMQKHGVEFGSHSLTHPWLPGVSDEQLRREVSDSKCRLEDLLGVEVKSFAYPYGGVDRRVRSAVAEAGYQLAFTTIPGTNWWNDPLCQRRAEVNDTTSVAEFLFKLRYGYGFRMALGAWRSRFGKRT